jgi:threonyl-tRNA synthetase
MRVRSFTLADAHIFCADENQAGDEISRALDLIDFIAEKFGLKMGEDYWYTLSLGDRTDEKKYFKDDAAWDTAEDILRNILKNRDCHFTEEANEAAFYGPKIDVQMKNVSGKEDTAFTVQYDFVMPKRFNLVYTNEQGEEQETIVVHRSSIGALERIMAFLIEHYAGAFPLWLAPVQVVIIPVSDKFSDYGREVLKQLQSEGIRVELDNDSETLGKRVRVAQKAKVPYMLVVGEKEMTDKTIAVRSRDNGDKGVININDFIENIKKEIG